jgi:hypothetical protein
MSATYPAKIRVGDAVGTRQQHERRKRKTRKSVTGRCCMKETKKIEDEENKAIEEEDKRIRGITEPTEIELNEEDEVNAKLFENDEDTEVDQSSPAYKKTKGTASTLKLKTYD